MFPLRRFLLLLIVSTLSVRGATVASAAFPLSVAPGGRHLVDARQRPFLYHAVTALADDGSFALSYLPSPRPLTVDLGRLAGERVQAAWFNPRTGETTTIDETPGKTRRTFTPPGEGDWVLVLDTAARDLPTPTPPRIP